MLDRRLCVAVALISLGMATTPVRAQEPAHATQPYETRLEGLAADEATALIDSLQQAQNSLRRGDQLYFELLSGAPAAYPMTNTSPREAFLSADFSHPFQVRRLPSAGTPKVYRVILAPNGLGKLLWDVSVAFGYSGQLDRFEMVYRPPRPY